MVHMKRYLKGPSRTGSSKKGNKVTFERCYTEWDNNVAKVFFSILETRLH